MVKCGKVGYQPGAISAGIALIESCLTNKVFVRACVRACVVNGLQFYLLVLDIHKLLFCSCLAPSLIP